MAVEVKVKMDFVMMTVKAAGFEAVCILTSLIVSSCEKASKCSSEWCANMKTGVCVCVCVCGTCMRKACGVCIHSMVGMEVITPLPLPCTQWSGQQPPACIDAPPGPALLKHIMNQVYNHAIDNPGLLNQYEPFSPEVSTEIEVRR